MPEATPQPETSFQNMVDHQYSRKASSATREFPQGLFGIIPGSYPPQWTLNQLARELMGEYITQVKNKRAVWRESDTQVVGIIQQTLNAYADLLGKLTQQQFDNAPDEWTEGLARVTA